VPRFRELKRRVPRFSLSARLTLWYVGLLAATLALVVASLFYISARLTRAGTLDQAARFADQARLTLAGAAAKGRPFDLAARELFEQDGTLNETPILVLDGSGAPIAQSAAANALNASVRTEGVDAVRGGTPTWLSVVDSAQVPAAVAISAVPDAAGGVAGFVQVILPLETAEVTSRYITVVVAVGLGLVVIVAALVGPLLTSLGLRPLRTVARASRRLAEGDLSTRVEVPDTADEVGDLARAFNHMAEQLEAAFAAQRAFVADASHELRTPLHALGGQLDVQMRVMESRPEEARRLATFMRREVDRLTSLIEALLVLARMEAQGAEALQFESVDLAAVARDVVEQARALPVASKRMLYLDLDQPPVRVQGDRHRLHEVVLNLTTNALQHIPEGGCATVAVYRDQSAACVDVRDTGGGVPPEHLEHIFDRFYRADSARSRASGGAGLGLAISRAIVEAHRGTVSVSNAPGGGAIFCVRLPIP